MTKNTSADTFAAIVLAAGLGTRMESDVPKVLHRLAGRPMIAHLMASLAEAGVARAVVVVGPGMDAIAEVVAPHTTAVQAEQLGTGDAALAAKEALAGFSGDVLILNGDAPLITPEGHGIGTLCVIDWEPRELSGSLDQAKHFHDKL